MVSLLKLTGSEAQLASTHQELCGETADTACIRYVAFDMHKHCGTSRYEKLQSAALRLWTRSSLTHWAVLWDQLKDVDSWGHFTAARGADGTLAAVQRTQQGVARTNCKDNLDRTNLVQTYIALRHVWEQLQDVGVYGALASTQQEADWVSFVRHVWADNGDALSLQYAGTPAVAGAVTRTGKGSLLGLLKDGVNSVTRYYINNFLDADKQDALDLFAGHSVYHAPVKQSPKR